MNNLLNIKTGPGPSSRVQDDFGLLNQGLSNLNTVYWNLPPEALVKRLSSGAGMILARRRSSSAPQTHRPRRAQDKFIVREATTENHVWWGGTTARWHPKSSTDYLGWLRILAGRDVFVQDCYAGATRTIACRSAS